MRLNQFEYLLALQRHGNFSRAAEELYVTQPSISVAIRELEEELGYALLLRSKKGVSFTAEGLIVLEKAERIMREVNSLRRPKPAEKSTLTGSVSISSTPHFCNALLTDVLYALERLHPAMTLDIQARDSMSIIELVRGGELDLGLIQLCDVEEDRLAEYTAAGSLTCVPLFTEPLLMAVAEHHPLAGRPIRDPMELEPYPYATFGRSINRQVLKLFQTYGWERKIYCIGDVLALRRFIFRQKAISMVPASGLLYGNASCADTMVALNVPCLDWDWKRRICLIGQPDGERPQRKEVVRLLKERCQEFAETCTEDT